MWLDGQWLVSDVSGINENVWKKQKDDVWSDDIIIII